jgi:hypothetical protein
MKLSLHSLLTAILMAVSAALALPSDTNAAVNDTWSRRFGDRSSELVHNVAVDQLGDAILVGPFQGNLDFGGGTLDRYGQSDAFIAKLDSAGNHTWSASFGGTLHDTLVDVAVDASGDIVVVGYFRGSATFGDGQLTSAGGDDIIVAKFDSEGDHVWSKRFGDISDDHGISVEIDGDHNVVLSGRFTGTVSFGGDPLSTPGDSDMFLAMLNQDGDHIWSRQFGDRNDQSSVRIAVDTSNDILLTGRLHNTVDFGGGPLTSSGGSDIFVAKLDSVSGHVWSKRFGDTENDEGYEVATDSADNVLVTGDFSLTVDFGGIPLVANSAGTVSDAFVVKFDGAGNHMWSKRFGAGNYDRGVSISADPDDNVVVSGEFGGIVDFDGQEVRSEGNFGNIFLSKFNSEGQHLGTARFGNAHQYGGKLAVGPSGRVILTGGFNDDVEFPDALHSSVGFTDIFVASLSGMSYLDWDGDGCRDVRELSSDPSLGGDRDPRDRWDFYDVTFDRAVDFDDALFILTKFGLGVEHVDYRPELDRYAPDPTRPWRTALESNGIDLNEALLSLGSFGHGCRGLP